MNQKIRKDAVLYFPPSAIGERGGAHCGACFMYITTGKCAAVVGDIDPKNGVCGLYVNGRPSDTGRMGTLPKRFADYTENGPTHCGNCEYYGGGEHQEGECEKVEGPVQYHGCCNHWSSYA